jgi:hypothetical protein
MRHSDTSDKGVTHMDGTTQSFPNGGQLSRFCGSADIKDQDPVSQIGLEDFIKSRDQR